MKACPICEEPLEELGLADVLDRAERVQLVNTWRCRLCGEEFVERLSAPPGWRDEIRAAVRAYRRAS